MKEILIDVHIIIEYLKTGKGLLPKVYNEYKMKIVASTFTELLGSQTFEDEQLQKEVIDFTDKYFTVVDINMELAKHAAHILRMHKVPMAVAFVAAAAKMHSMPLVTDEPEHFEGIEGIEIMKFDE